ncbi:bifunctional 4-hydroxy-2-oxoglutarate aldolase/2-dehydro-3-deoxy-phosphogluconate aldolase [Priestia filamentosa]|uniref:bifunctional 4-hydroxy-2-oxoglutarate aldolase/2-dehydro-3-deoxy-phosphogluconate aldolase n=1 Tax=Priestia filamentosa TaxID=1402861 RepID=UPI002E1BFC98|nr:bifunctional 4-hydroxy-2-oxoglutarate aldolase/2-dehydro-3-deoxy-phosphogluconate aldolase [Priestia filamentosa]
MIPKVNLMNKLTESGIIAVLRNIPHDKMEQVAESIVKGGVTTLEVTVDCPGAFEMIRKLSMNLKNQAIVGAGTVLDAESAKKAIDYGAEFIFSPSLHQDVIRTSLRYGKIVVPGVMTPTEMITAIEWGADLVKVFPADGLGVKYIKNVKGPFSHIPIIPTGGVNLDNISSFINVGVAAVGIGGNLLDSNAIQDSDFSKITCIASQYVEAVQKARAVIIQ